ncbi:lipid II flippase MurJ [Telluria sp. B2]
MRRLIQLGLLSAGNIALAFLFQWYVITHLGPGIETDALFAGMSLPQLVLTVISGSLVHVLVPLLSGENDEQLRQDAWGFLILVGGLFTLLATIFYLTAQWWVPFMLPGFNDAAISLTIDLTRIQLIGMIFTALNGVQWSTYYARQKFIWAECAPIIASVLTLLLLIWALPRYGVAAAAWISSARIGLQTLLLAPGMGNPRLPDLQRPAIRLAWKRIKPMLLGTTYYKTEPLVDRFLLSNTGSGSLSLYYLAQQIFSAAIQVINKAISTPLVPELSKMHKAGDRVGFQRTYRSKLIYVSLVSTAGLLVLVMIGHAFLRLLLAGHGNVSASDVEQLWWIMLWLGGMFFGGAAGQICSSTFYACGDTVTPVKMSIFTYTVYVPTKIGAFYYYDLMGLAIVTSVYFIVNLAVQILLLEKNFATPA